MKVTISPIWVLLGLLAAGLGWGWKGFAVGVGLFLLFMYALMPLVMMIVQRMSLSKRLAVMEKRHRLYRRMLGESISLLNSQTIEHLKHNGPNLARSIRDALDSHDAET